MSGLRTRLGRLSLLFFAVISLFGGIVLGLYRIGFQSPPSFPLPPLLHPALMISGFLGTVIALERAVAYAKVFGYLAPLLNLVSIAAMLATPQGFAAPLFALLAGTLLAGVMLSFFQREPTLHAAILGFAPFFWMTGSLLWLLGYPFPKIDPWWAIFLVLTIAGERLELSRIRGLPKNTPYVFIVIILFMTSGALSSFFSLKNGWTISAVGFVLLGLWLLRHDMAVINLKQKGLPRFIALSLLTGYIWLVISGILIFFWDGLAGGFIYDSFLHALFLGFLFSMIFGHAPIIFPAILMVGIKYSGVFYIHLVLLHLSLAVRLVGDMVAHPELRMWAGGFNGVAIILFLVATVSSLRPRRSRSWR